jgi:hypothetical protein
VLGTLSAAVAVVKRFWQAPFPLNVDNHVQTMCIVPGLLVDHSHLAGEPRRGLCGNLLGHWSGQNC